MRILVTGAAGFIGYHLAKRLIEDGHSVFGIDNLNDYYSPELKKDRLKQLQNHKNASKFKFQKIDLADGNQLTELFQQHAFSHVINLAAQAGVRYSLINPHAYISSNLTGFGNLLECCRNFTPKHLLFASSSSVYGLNETWPYSVHDNVDHPVSLYAATKKSNELMAHSYSHLFNISASGLRFFTVYGPWGRPDMALFLFTKAILEGSPINIFNNGHLQRDFTHINDIIEGIVRILEKPAAPNPDFNPAMPDPGSSTAPWKIYNIGNNNTVRLGDFIEILEDAIGKKAIKNYLPMQPGDVKSTWADISDLEKSIGYTPSTSLEAGIKDYVRWHKSYYGK